VAEGPNKMDAKIKTVNLVLRLALRLLARTSQKFR
jgi:hypothetical protein